MGAPRTPTEHLPTARLSLHRPTVDDVDAIFTIHNDPLTCVHNPSDALTERAQAQRLYARWNDQWQRHGYGYWVVRLHGQNRALGFCGIKPMDLAEKSVLNLFCRFAPSAWGHGYATEATTAVVSWVSRHLPHMPLTARIRPDNLASQRLVTRVGLARAAHLDGPGYDGDDWIYVAQWPD
ncbi:GNAT family N-acetyltransferase [Nocardia bovistercoris]|uniref:GNAT family N-acetyltransferase n=1 Tax=Nocardia bovistercoris TaxID=2785916 RepID=A0A931IB59_9NOCA|nr:GNAT family N-acetyltransferase [Nocardia bovistercoris]MBH0777806.1 GNAT family N-acetyltransferase [Nocardia bovistercoris]